MIWNGQHDFFSFRFYAERTSGGGLTLNIWQPLVFLLLCGLILGPVHSWAIARYGAQRWRSRGRGATAGIAEVYPAVALWVFAVSTGAFTALSLVSVAYYYWNILAYPLLLPLLAELFLPAADRAQPVRRRPLLAAQLIGLTAAATLIFHYTVVPLTALIPGAVDPDSAALFGWAEIAAEVEAQASTLENPLLLTTDYRSAGALGYQLNDPNVIAISGRLDQFDFWYDAAAMQGRDAVLLGESWHPICPAHLAMFERTAPPQEIAIARFGVVLQTYTLVRGYGFQAGPENYPLQADYPLAFTSDGQRCGPN